MISRRKRRIATTVLFLSGIPLGAVLMNIFMRYQLLNAPVGSRMGMKRLIMLELVDRLDLNHDQIMKIDLRVQKMQDQLWEVRRAMQPQIISILDRNIQQGKADLDDKQREKLDDVFDRLKKRWDRELTEPNDPTKHG